MKPRTLQRVVALVFVTLVATSATVAGVTTVAAQEDDGPEFPPVDEIYVEEDGDAVLVYENDSEGTQTEFGVDVGTNLLHALVVSDADTEEIQASGSALLTNDRFDGNATLSVPRPDAVTDLSVDVTGMQTRENAEFDATAEATISSRNASVAALAQEATARGNVTVTATRFRAVGEFDTTLARPIGVAQHQSFRVTERDGGYVLDAAQNYTVPERQRVAWNTSARAKATLERQYAALARAYGGSAEVSLGAHEFTEVRDGVYRLDIEYTITYQDIEEGLARQLTGMLATADDVDLNESQLADIRTRIQELTISEVSVRYDQQRESIDAAFTVDLDNYNEAVFAALDVAAAVEREDVSVDADLSRFRDTFEAQQAANLERRYTFSASVEAESRTESAFQAEVHYRTQNWEAYVQELENRGIERADATYELHAETAGDRIDTTAAIEIEQENLVRRLSDAALNATDDDPEAEEFLRTFREADFRRARMDVSMRDGRVRFEAGTAFENMTALRDSLAESGELPRFTTIVGRTDNDTLRTYVRVEGAVSGDASESDVRALPYVNEDTEVHMPGTWDREFPSPDTERARTYLGITPTPANGGGGGDGETGTSGGVPGFGVPVAVVALLAAAALLARRRR